MKNNDGPISARD